MGEERRGPFVAVARFFLGRKTRDRERGGGAWQTGGGGSDGTMWAWGGCRPAGLTETPGITSGRQGGRPDLFVRDNDPGRGA